MPSPELVALQGEIDRLCMRLGIGADPRKFVPHVTLARLRNSSPGDVANYLSARGNFSTLPFKVGRFVLMSSRDSVGGGPYVVEEVWPLFEAAPVPAGRLARLEQPRYLR
jgi:2'-5' RNA ligase